MSNLSQMCFFKTNDTLNHIGSDFDNSASTDGIRHVSMMLLGFQEMKNTLDFTNQEVTEIKNGNVLRDLRIARKIEFFVFLPNRVTGILTRRERRGLY